MRTNKMNAKTYETKGAAGRGEQLRAEVRNQTREVFLMTTMLTSSQLWTIANALRSAAARYAEFSTMKPSHSLLDEQFKKQAADALQFAELFENAAYANVG